MNQSLRWSLLVPLSLGLAACTESRTPANASTAATPSSTTTAAMTTMAAEPTFESIPSPKEMMELLRKGLRDPVDTEQEQQALKVVEGSLGTFEYARPDTLVGVDPNVEGPLGISFIADSEWAGQRVRELLGSSMDVSCLTRPCIHYGDFDRDGTGDLAVQVADDKETKSGIVFLLSDKTHAVLGAGRESAIGDDLLPWMDTWRVVPHPSGKGHALVLGSTLQRAQVELSDKPGSGGAREVIAAWSCGPTRQHPVMEGPQGPEGIVTSSGVFEGSEQFAAWHAFDDKESSLWVSEGWTSKPVWLGFAWNEGPRHVTRYALTFNDKETSRAPRDFTLEGWDGKDWVTVDSRTDEIEWKSPETRLFTVSRPGAYRQYRLHITEDNDPREVIVAVSLERFELLGGNCGEDK